MEIQTTSNTSHHVSYDPQPNIRYTDFKEGNRGKGWYQVAVIVISIVVVGSLSLGVCRWIRLSQLGMLGKFSHDWSVLVSTGTSITGTVLLVFLCICQKSKTIKHEHDATHTSTKLPTQSLDEEESSVRSEATTLTNAPTRQPRPTVKKEESFDWEQYFSENHFQEHNLNEMGYEVFLSPRTYVVKYFEESEMCVVIKTPQHRLSCSRKINEGTFLRIKDQLLKLRYKENELEGDTSDHQIYDLLSTDFIGREVPFENFQNYPNLPRRCFFVLTVGHTDPETSIFVTDDSEMHNFIVVRTRKGILLCTTLANQDQVDRWSECLCLKGYNEYTGPLLYDNFENCDLSKEDCQSLPSGFFLEQEYGYKDLTTGKFEPIESEYRYFIIAKSHEGVLLCSLLTSLSQMKLWAETLYSQSYFKGSFIENDFFHQIGENKERFKHLAQGEYVAGCKSFLGGIIRMSNKNFFVVKTKRGELFCTTFIDDDKKYLFEKTLALSYRKSTMKF